MRRPLTNKFMSADHTPQPPTVQELAPLVYDELRRLAAAYMRRERPGQTLQATALVHEAYLRLAGAGTPCHDERHFVGIAARSMRQILVERARARGAQKRWAGLDRVTMTDALAVAAEPVTMLPALDEALTRLEVIDAEQARIVELRYFAGLSVDDTADALGMSPATLKRRWALARAWLFSRDEPRMTPEQRRRVRDLFEAVADLEPATARRWVERDVADDPAVRAEVLSLVDHHSRAGAFLSQPIAERAADLLADDEPLAPGARVGTYTIVRELGRGGMGRVYLASDARLGRTVALKALAPHLMRDPSPRERLRREARAAAALTHPGICTVYALEEIDGDLYLATEFVDGHTLGEEIRSAGRPTREEILRTARELAAALASAHAKGIVHRDFKPDNVMRARDGRLKILDFGLARVGAGEGEDVTRMTQPGMIVGTPAYMAPEQINGLAIDARADVFAFGVLLYEYACGAHPFAASTMLATVARVLESDARPLSGQCAVPLRVAEVIARCLRKAPSERFGSAAELVGALEVAADAESPAASPHATWWRTHQIVVAALYVGAAALAWQLKEWIETPVTVSIFLALSGAATTGSMLRGHLVFTSVMNQPHLTTERRRTRGATRLIDLLTAALLFADAVIIARRWALPGVVALALALGIALASVVLDPATTAAAFGEDS
jgi:RNA polymerase sigma factor (TIGR02999 family)